MSQLTLQQKNELDITNLSTKQKQNKIKELLHFEEQLKSDIFDPDSITHKIMFSDIKDIVLYWAKTIEALHYLGSYDDPLTTISSYIVKQVRLMKLDDKKIINLSEYVRKCLPDKFKHPNLQRKKNGGNDSRQNTSGVNNDACKNDEKLNEQSSLILESLATLKYYHLEFAKIISIFEAHLSNPDIHKDMVKWFDKWEKIASLCEPLAELSGKYSVLQQMADEGNLRESATILQKSMAKLLESDLSFRQMAHGFAVSPRQNQRIRSRLEDWPKKDINTVIRKNILSFCCQSCGLHLITGKKYTKNGEESDSLNVYGKKYKIPKEFSGKLLNPIQIAEQIWKGKLKQV